MAVTLYLSAAAMVRAGSAKSVGTKRTQQERQRDALGLGTGSDPDDRE